MIVVQGMSFSYRRNKPVLDQINLQMDAGGVYGVLGANGVGKTTLLHLLGGLLFPSSGNISVDGMKPMLRQPAFLEQVYYVPVAFDLPRITVQAYQQRYAPFYRQFSFTTWAHALETFGIDANASLAHLSFGQKKKVLLSFAIASGCRILVFYEPTDGLDIPSKDNFRRLLSARIDEQRLAIIATHHVQDVAMLLDHLVVLKDQHVLMQSSIEQLTARVRTATTTQLPGADELLYSERVPGGHHCLLRNTQGQEGPLDLELLFKALQSHPEIVQNSLTHEQHI